MKSRINKKNKNTKNDTAVEITENIEKLSTTKSCFNNKNRTKLPWKNLPKFLITPQKLDRSVFKNFFLLIYLLYFRYTVEFGISVLTYPEAIAVNTILGFLLFSIVNQGSRFIFNAVIFLYKLARVVWWAYYHVDNAIMKIDQGNQL